MPYINPTVRAIYIDEYDYEIIAELIEAKISKLKASAGQCSRGYGSSAALEKEKKLLDQANHLRILLSNLTTEIV